MRSRERGAILNSFKITSGGDSVNLIGGESTYKTRKYVFCVVSNCIQQFLVICFTVLSGICSSAKNH